MAARLQGHLHSSGNTLGYSNRTTARGKPLDELGAKLYATFENLVQACDTIFIMVSDDAAVLELAERAARLGNLDGKVFIDTSTVHPATSRSVKAILDAKQARFVASPVFGASLQAKNGQLIFAMAGPTPTIDHLRPYLLGVMGKSIVDCGEDVAKSSLMKISG